MNFKNIICLKYISMTFTPQVLSQVDNNNSIINSTDTSFNGISTITTGFNTLILTIKSTTDSTSGGIQIQFSDDNSTWISPFADTYFSTNTFTKNYLIIKKYYRIVYTNTLSGTFTITSRLSTDLDSSIVQSTSINVFNSNVENTLDAFGKLRVSNPVSLLDIRFPGQSDGSANFLNNYIQICDASSGNYTGVYSNSKLVISATGNGYYISQSRNYCAYQPGKSLLFLASGILNPGNANYTTRIGYFDNEIPLTNNLTVKNGVYFECSGNEYSINISSNSTKFINVIRSDWNIDKMNGTGPSGLTLDFTKTQLFVADMEWLGVGRVRFGFYAYGRIQYCHQVINVNTLTSPYTTSINLPICFSIHSNLSPGTPANNFTQICSAVISEGGYGPLGRPFSVSTQTTGINVSANTETPIIFLKGGGSNYYHQNIIPTSYSMIGASTNDLILFKLVLFLAGTYTVAEPTWTNVNSGYSVAQYAINTQTPTLPYSITNGIVLDQGYFFGRGTNSFTTLGDIFSSQILQLTSDINNNPDILVLTATFINTGGGSTSSIRGAIQWQEIY
jgi:hypothetical protein